MKRLALPLLIFASAVHAEPFRLDGNPLRAEKLFLTHCAACHGEKGNGVGSASAGLSPRPTDFTSQANRTRLTEEWVYKIISQGGAANGRSPLMISWVNTFTDQQIRDLAAYVLLFKPFAPPSLAPSGEPDDAVLCVELSLDQSIAAMKQLPRGARFTTFCPPCGDAMPSAPATVQSVAVEDSTTAGKKLVVLNGRRIDLGYTFAKLDGPGSVFKNIGKAAGCSMPKVAATLDMTPFLPVPRAASANLLGSKDVIRIEFTTDESERASFVFEGRSLFSVAAPRNMIFDGVTVQRLPRVSREFVVLTFQTGPALEDGTEVAAVVVGADDNCQLKVIEQARDTDGDRLKAAKAATAAVLSKLDPSRFAKSCAALAQGQRDHGGAGSISGENSPRVEAIRTRYQAVGASQRTFAKVEKSIFGMSAEGSSLVGYFDGRNLKKAEWTIFGEGGKQVREMTFHEGRLEFAFMKTEAGGIGGPGWTDSEERYYLDNGDVIWATRGKSRDAMNATDIDAAKKDVLQMESQVLEALKAKPTELWFEDGKFGPMRK